MDKKEISLYDLFDVLKKHWLIVLICAVILGAIFGIYSVRSYVATYTADVTFYVSPSGDQNSGTWEGTDSTKLSWALKIINSYVEILSTNSFADKVNETVLETLGEEKYDSFNLSRDYINKIIKLSIHEDSNVFTASVTTTDPEKTYSIAKAVEDIAPEHIDSITGLEKTITSMDSPEMPVKPSNGNHMYRNTVIGLALGALISFIVAFVVEILDVRVKSEEDLVSNYEFPLLGTIPDYTSDMKTRQGY